jgi:hypothetical protein
MPGVLERIDDAINLGFARYEEWEARMNAEETAEGKAALLVRAWDYLPPQLKQKVKLEEPEIYRTIEEHLRRLGRIKEV